MKKQKERRRARSQTNVDAASCYEYASRMQTLKCLFYAFHASTHFLHHMFHTFLFLLERGAHFCKTASSDFNQNFCSFHSQTALIRVFFVVLFAHLALLAVPIATFSLRALFKILLVAAVPCVFRSLSPINENG